MTDHATTPDPAVAPAAKEKVDTSVPASARIWNYWLGGKDNYAEFVKSAYHQSDLDTVRVIRMIAESGRIQ